MRITPSSLINFHFSSDVFWFAILEDIAATSIVFADKQTEGSDVGGRRRNTFKECKAAVFESAAQDPRCGCGWFRTIGDDLQPTELALIERTLHELHGPSGRLEDRTHLNREIESGAACRLARDNGYGLRRMLPEHRDQSLSGFQECGGRTLLACVFDSGHQLEFQSGVRLFKDSHCPRLLLNRVPQLLQAGVKLRDLPPANHLDLAGSVPLPGNGVDLVSQQFILSLKRDHLIFQFRKTRTDFRQFFRRKVLLLESGDEFVPLPELLLQSLRPPSKRPLDTSEKAGWALRPSRRAKT